MTIKRTYKLDGRKVRTNFIIIKRDAFKQLDAIAGDCQEPEAVVGE
jgi:hypothetical protein